MTTETIGPGLVHRIRQLRYIPVPRACGQKPLISMGIAVAGNTVGRHGLIHIAFCMFDGLMAVEAAGVFRGDMVEMEQFFIACFLDVFRLVVTGKTVLFLNKTPSNDGYRLKGPLIKEGLYFDALRILKDVKMATCTCDPRISQHLVSNRFIVRCLDRFCRQIVA